MRMVFGIVQALAITLAIALGSVAAALAQSATQSIALETSLTGSAAYHGIAALEGARLAVEEANQDASEAPVSITVQDDQSVPEKAAAVARGIAASDAVAEIGPILTVSAIATGPIYARAGLAAIVPTATGDAVPAAATTYQSIFSTGSLGAALANYLLYALHGQCASMLYRDDAYGQPVAAGFKAAAARLRVTASFYPFTDAAGRAEAEQTAADLAAGDACYPAFVLAMPADDAVPVVEALRRGGFTGPILGTDTLAGDGFAKLFAATPEEQAKPGFFTSNLYAAAPIILDSADNPAHAFARRFRARFGHAPPWTAVQSYDATMLSIAAVRQAAQTAGASGAVAVRRKAVLDYLAALNSPANAYPGLTGPIWFTASRGRLQRLRIGNFEGGLFVSAPLQLVPVAQPDPEQIISGEVRNIGDGYARIQQVVYTGMYLNEVPRLDIAGSSFTADFYLWLRYMPAPDIGGQDPADIVFPDLIDGSFDPRQPVLTRSLPDGSVYKLWQVRGQFKNDYDLHRYPFDKQLLVVRMFNARADSTRVVYVPDRLSFPDTDRTGPAPAAAGNGALAEEPAAMDGPPNPDFSPEAAPAAFRNLTHWTPLSVEQFRNNLVTLSGLGDPALVGLERQRELSGFELSIELRRNLLSSITKTLLPLALMTLIMFSSLYFPPGLVKEKVTVAVTGALSGAVLLASLNNQLGGVGYVMAIEYIFYVYFALSLLCIIAVLTTERFRAAGRREAAALADTSSRALFAFLVAVTVIIVVVSHTR